MVFFALEEFDQPVVDDIPEDDVRLDKAIEETNERLVGIDEANQAIEEFVQYQEILSIDTNEELPESTVAAVSVAVESIYKRLGVEGYRLSMEHRVDKRMALESAVKEGIRKTWEAIKRTFQKLREWFKEVVDRLFGKKGRSERITNKITASIKENNQERPTPKILSISRNTSAIKTLLNYGAKIKNDELSENEVYHAIKKMHDEYNTTNDQVDTALKKLLQSPTKALDIAFHSVYENIHIVYDGGDNPDSLSIEITKNETEYDKQYDSLPEKITVHVPDFRELNKWLNDLKTALKDIQDYGRDFEALLDQAYEEVESMQKNMGEDPNSTNTADARRILKVSTAIGRSAKVSAIHSFNDIVAVVALIS